MSAVKPTVFSVQTQESLVPNDNSKSYGTKSDSTHVWVPTDGDTPANGPTCTGLNHKVGPQKGSTLTIHDINYTVKVKEKACGCSSQNKDILKDVK